MTELHNMSAVKTKEIEMTQRPLTETPNKNGGNVYYESQPSKLGMMKSVKNKVIEMVQFPIADGKN